MKCKDCDCCKLVTVERWDGEKFDLVQTQEYECWGVKETFTIKDINKQCTEYEHKRNQKPINKMSKDDELKITRKFIVEKGLLHELLDYYNKTKE